MTGRPQAPGPPSRRHGRLLVPGIRRSSVIARPQSRPAADGPAAQDPALGPSRQTLPKKPPGGPDTPASGFPATSRRQRPALSHKNIAFRAFQVQDAPDAFIPLSGQDSAPGRRLGSASDAPPWTALTGRRRRQRHRMPVGSDETSLISAQTGPEARFGVPPDRQRPFRDDDRKTAGKSRRPTGRPGNLGRGIAIGTPIRYLHPSALTRSEERACR